MRRVIVLTLWLVACGEEADPTNAYFEPLCGKDGPVELLGLGGDEQVARFERVSEDGDLHIRVSNSDQTEWVRSAVVDECGELVAEPGMEILGMTRWGDALVGCTTSYDLARFAAYDDPSPVVLARRGCGARPLGELFVTYDVEPEGTTGRLVALEPMGAEVMVRVLVEDVVTEDQSATVAGDRAFVQTSDLAVHSVDARTGEVTLELEQAGLWSASANAIAYQAPDLGPDEAAPLVFRDRGTGTDETLDVGLRSSWSLRWFEGALLAEAPYDPSKEPVDPRWFRADPARELVAPTDTRIEVVRADGLVWLGLHHTNDDYELLRWHEGEAPQSAMTCTDCTLSQRGSDFIDVLVNAGFTGRYELWRLDDSGGPARQLASPVGLTYRVMDDGRVVTVLVGQDFEFGALELVNGSEGDSVTLAPRVNLFASLIDALSDGLHDDTPDEILYEAWPSHGTHAVYRARLSP